MPRTEAGPAMHKRSREWNPADARSPITRRDRRDARFRNTTSKPTRRGKQAVGPATGITRSNLNPGESVYDKKPGFDRCVYVPAVCEGAICGGEDSAKITGSPTSYEDLTSKAQTKLNLVAATVPGAPPHLGRIFAAAIMKHELFRPKKIKHDDGSVTIEHVLFVLHNGRLLPHIFRGWFGQGYPWRWDQAASCYLDIRIDGKATNSTDPTWTQAAGRIADEALDNFSTQPNRHAGRRCPLIFYEKPFLCIFLFWLMAGLDAPLSDFWLFAAEPPSTEKKTRRYIPSNIYWRRKEDRRVDELVSLAALLSVKIPRLARYYRECWGRVAKANQDKRPVARTERDKVITDHWPLVADKCRKVPQAHRADAIQACMERLVKVYDNDWRPELGTFGTFAAQAIDWAIQDFMKGLRQQVPVQRSINLNEPAPDDDDDDKPTEPERSDMLKLNTLEKNATAAKRRLIAERLGCLTPRERRVIEGRLALNGYKEPVTHKALAAELGTSATSVRRVEDDAVAKLQQAVAC
jgi:RNA polymerase sigma factor (sigma-70 family)